MPGDVLLVMGMQNCFAAEHDTVREAAERIKTHIDEEAYDAIIFTKFVNSEQSPFMVVLEEERCMEEPGTEIVDALQDVAAEHTVIETDTYSVFNAQQFYGVMDDVNPERIYLVGADVDGAIIATLFDAFDLGYHAHVHDDLTVSTGGADVAEAAWTIIDNNLRSE